MQNMESMQDNEGDVDEDDLGATDEHHIRASREWNMKNPAVKVAESLDFDQPESIVWRKHHLRRFFQERLVWWTQHRRTTAYKWVLVFYVGVIIAALGAIVIALTLVLFDVKFEPSWEMMEDGDRNRAFFYFLALSLAYSAVATSICAFEPAAAGAGIAEVKAFLNGVNLNKFVRIRVMYCKVIGMCFSVASGLPLGKEGPLIHCGAIVGAAVSQGRTNFFGFDTSWTKYQDLRNDLSKRDYITYGAAAGIAAAFRSPIGGIMFTLEEGASFWSNSVTFRAFFCGLITVLALSLMFYGRGTNSSLGMYSFGNFVEFNENKPNYQTYELAFFGILGVMGGFLGALFNSINRRVNNFRKRTLTTVPWKMTEVMLMTLVWCIVSFLMPLIWHECTPLPTDTADWTSGEENLLNELVRFNCPENNYNQVASLFFTPADVAMQQMFHYREYDETSYTSFSTGALIMFFVPYFLMAAYTAGSFITAGLFVPTLVAGAAFGRLVGHLLNVAFAGFVADSGTYALIGAAAVLGGMSRMTIAGTVIVLEACGNSTYLLPLMITFAAARYTGNAINDGMYDMQMKTRQYPFLEGSMPALGLLNYHPTSEIMSSPVVCFREIDSVARIYGVLKNNTHNGFPIVDAEGKLRGFILRKTLCSLLKYRVFSSAMDARTATGDASGSSNSASHNGSGLPGADGSSSGKQQLMLSTAATVFWDTMEREYPKYPKIADVKLSNNDFNRWLDLRMYMDTSPYSIDESASVQRAYRYFRTMGLRHLVVLNQQHAVVGILTRVDLVEHRLEHHSFDEESQTFQKHVKLDDQSPIVVNEDENMVLLSATGSGHGSSANGRGGGDNARPGSLSSAAGARVDDGRDSVGSTLTLTRPSFINSSVPPMLGGMGSGAGGSLARTGDIRAPLISPPTDQGPSPPLSSSFSTDMAPSATALNAAGAAASASRGSSASASAAAGLSNRGAQSAAGSASASSSTRAAREPKSAQQW